MKKIRSLSSSLTGGSRNTVDFISTEFKHPTQIVFKTYVL